MALFKNDGFVADPWRTLREGESAPPSGHAIFPLDWWKQERDAFAGSHAPLGLRLEPDARLEDIVDDLPRFALIAIVFPKFGDGRGFSLAHLLRTRRGFTGEIRATGEVLFDQLQAMARSGFDAFEIVDPATLRALQAGRRPVVTHAYQSGPGGDRPTARRRGWRTAGL
jgi:uncharacterized protein (DUF934 family)